jgi:hypothetical protein
MEKLLQKKLLLYLVVSALGFVYLVLPQDAGVSVPVYVLLQCFCLWFLLRPEEESGSSSRFFFSPEPLPQRQSHLGRLQLSRLRGLIQRDAPAV